MKILYLAKFSYDNKEDSGILKKIFYQKNALEKMKNKVILKSTDYKKLYSDKKEIKKYKNSYQAKLSWLNDSLSEEKIQNYDVVYIRNSSVDFGMINALKKIQNKKILLEIPTYPYDNEKKMDSIKNIVTILSDRVSRRYLKGLVNKIVTYSEDKEIWGIPCINISNGIDLEEVKMVNRRNRDVNKIVFTSVSNCSFWHGIDRLLYSLEEYGKLKNKKEIQFNIVGEGSESNKLKEIISKNEYLSKVVVFQGFKSGKDLDDIYDETDIGIGSLGRHRSGLDTMRALKNREYCAKGLPMIFSEDDPDLRCVPFVYHTSADEKLIDIEAVIKWYENMNLKSEDIRKYSEQFSWDIQMKKVINEIEKINLEIGV